jgi:hypothetical protein
MGLRLGWFPSLRDVPLTQTLTCVEREAEWNRCCICKLSAKEDPFLSVDGAGISDETDMSCVRGVSA